MNNNCSCSKNACGKDHKCRSITKKPIDIDTPVRVEPTVKVGRIKTEYQRPEVCWYDEGEADCKHACEFVIRQTISVEIPICYDVQTDVGESCVDCK